MTQNVLRKGAISVVVGLALVNVTSCDESFDLSNISTDINVGGSLSVPIGTTDTLKLSRIIDLTEELKVDENGFYALESSGNMSIDIAKVEEIRIENLSPRAVEVPLSVSGAGSVTADFPIHIPISETMSIDATEEIPEEVVRLSYVSVDPVPTYLVFDLTLDDQSVFSKLENLRVTDFEFRFPDVLEFAPGMEGMDYATNTLTVAGNFDSKGNLTIPLNIVGLKNIPEIRDRKIHIETAIPCKGTLQADAKGVSGADLAGFHLSIIYDIPDFTVDKAEGEFDAKIDIASERITLGELPDLLTDGNTEINLNTVAFAVALENPIGVPFDASLRLTALDKAGSPINEPVAVGLAVGKAVDYTTPGVSRFWITNSQTLQAPEGYEKVLVPDLNKLIKQVPESIQIDPSVEIDGAQDHFLQLGRQYQTVADYEIDMPFDFGPGSRVVYRETIDDLHSDLEDIADKVTELSVATEVFSTIPLAMNLEITPYDIHGNDMSDRLDYTKNLTLDAGSTSAPSQSKEIELKEQVPGALKDLERIDLTIEGNTDDAVAVLAPSQYLYVKIKAKLPQGVTITDEEE